MAHDLDEVDVEILHLLQDDARNNTNSWIADQLGVSPSTASKRIKKLQQSGIIKGYYPEVDYDASGFPLRVLFVCTAPITERSDRIQQVLDIPGVVSTMELMTGTNNIHIEVVGKSNDDISDLAFAITELGVQINEEVLVKNEHHKPASVFP
jgi:DNA-binding Lrp family transcriptional regulator